MRIIGIVTVLCFSLTLAACGGSSDNMNGTVTSVTATCVPSTVAPNSTSQCSFTLGCTGKACSTGVNWSASAGSINAAGLFTAPQTDATLQVTIKATSMQDPSKSGSTVVIVTFLTP